MDDTLSDEPELKLQAVVLLSDKHPDIAPLPAYLAACERWYATLSKREKLVAIETVLAFNSGDEDKALSTAAALPPAPHL